MTVPEPEEFPIDDIGTVLRFWLEQWRPGDLLIRVHGADALSGIPSNSPGSLPIGIPVWVSEGVPKGSFRIGFNPDRYEDALVDQRWRVHNTEQQTR